MRNNIPFDIDQNTDRDTPVSESIAYLKAGGAFLTAEQSLENMRAAIDAGADIRQQDADKTEPMPL
jgi:hypothetical protein